MNNLKNQGSKLKGVSYKKLKSQRGNEILKFNNGEPLDAAIRKIIAQLLIIVVVISSVLVLFSSINIVRDQLNNTSVFTLSTSRTYKMPISISGINVAIGNEKSAYTAIEAISGWLGEPIYLDTLKKNHDKDRTFTSSGTYDLLCEYFSDEQITLKRNISNYTYLTEIYESMQAGSLVLVPMEVPKALGDKNSYNYGYAIVTAIDFGNDIITVQNNLGRTDIFTAESFVAATRFENFQMPLDMRISFIMGLRTKNTAIIVNKL